MSLSLMVVCHSLAIANVARNRNMSEIIEEKDVVWPPSWHVRWAGQCAAPVTRGRLHSSCHVCVDEDGQDLSP